ncbi:MAG: cysteine-rich small domain-containing protein [Arcobacteraceae bacterium]|nr:cysteine-rich small domain-containing protein [Arcobacteraceae bacterium]
MSYQSWHQEHAQKHKKLLEKLREFSDEEVIEYFRFENMVIKEPDFCVLYKENKKCHDMENLNCYFCACPNFRVEEKQSSCAIKSIDGGSIEAPDGFIHQDCSKCTVPHKEEYIKQHFSRDWLKVMDKNF